MAVEILKVLVGSHAHGLATPESDLDYRGVFVNPTSEILSIGGQNKQTRWEEGTEDNTSWELGHFLFLATKSNPTILEVFKAPIVVGTFTQLGAGLQGLFPYVWSSKGVMDAHKGYGFNQRKKLLDNKDNRRAKYAAAHLRTLVNAWEILTTEDFTIRIADLPIGDTVRRWKNGLSSISDQKLMNGEVIDLTDKWIALVDEAYAKNPNKQTDLNRVNDFLLYVRQTHWW